MALLRLLMIPLSWQPASIRLAPLTGAQQRANEPTPAFCAAAEGSEVKQLVAGCHHLTKSPTRLSHRVYSFCSC